MTRFPPRIHVLLAREAPVGVVIRRGPSKSVGTFLWNRTTDDFSLGQWLRGRIYERRSDLSADGRFLLYFAMNGKLRSEAMGSWTAISRAPYLKAIAIFPKGDCWHGGGLFTTKSKYWLNDGYGHSVLRDSTEVQRDTKGTPSLDFGGECQGVYYNRLIRDGWRLIERRTINKLSEVDTFEKSLPNEWILRKLAHGQIGAPAGKGCYWDEHEIEHARTGKRMAHPDWEWAELDCRRLVWAKGGKLFAGQIRKEGLADVAELLDFEPMTFEAIKAPY